MNENHTDFISSLRTTVDFGFSNDLAGLLGRTDRAQEFYLHAMRQAGHMLGVDLSDRNTGTEALAVRKKIAHQLKKERRIPIIGLHGRTGPETVQRFFYDPIDTLFVFSIGALFHTTHEVSNLSHSQRHHRLQINPYVLVHEPEAWSLLQQAKKKPNGFPHPSTVYAVENHSYRTSTERSLSAVQEIQQLEGTALPVFDLVHFIRPLLKEGVSYTDAWNAMLRELTKHGKCLIHLPIGTYEKDSLDFKQIQTAMWIDLATQLQDQECFVILEHQLEGTRQRLQGNTVLTDNKLISGTADKIRLLYEIGIPGLRE